MVPKYDPNSQETYEIAERMGEHGGSFVKKLSELFFRGDYNNRLKIVNTWTNYFDDYAENPNNKRPAKQEIPERILKG